VRKVFSICSLVLILVLSPSLVAISSNQFKLIKLASQFEDFENHFALQNLMIDQGKMIDHDRGSGNYCLFIVEKTYNYIPSKQEKAEMSRFVFYPTAIPDDDSTAKVTISQNGSKLRVYVQDGPWDNVFDPRCS